MMFLVDAGLLLLWLHHRLAPRRMRRTREGALHMCNGGDGRPLCF